MSALDAFNKILVEMDEAFKPPPDHEDDRRIKEAEVEDHARG